MRRSWELHQQVATDAFGNALGDAVVANMSSPSAADNRAALNAAERAADPERYTTPAGGSGLRVGGGGSGLRFDGSALASWNRELDEGIAREAARSSTIGAPRSSVSAIYNLMMRRVAVVGTLPASCPPRA